jgi:hypothetical protein
LTRTKKGTDETSKVSDTSGSSSASICFTGKNCNLVALKYLGKCCGGVFCR